MPQRRPRGRPARRSVELYHQADKVAKQVRYTSRKGIPFVWFPPFEEGAAHGVKDLATGEQTASDPTNWVPAAR